MFTVQSNIVKVLVEQEKYASMTHLLKKNKTKKNHLGKRDSKLAIEEGSEANTSFQ